MKRTGCQANKFVFSSWRFMAFKSIHFVKRVLWWKFDSSSFSNLQRHQSPQTLSKDVFGYNFHHPSGLQKDKCISIFFFVKHAFLTFSESSRSGCFEIRKRRKTFYLWFSTKNVHKKLYEINLQIINIFTIWIDLICTK